MIKKVLNFLKGKKTYVVGISMIIVGLYNGNKETVLVGLGMMGLRSAIENK
jgi:hypothetical protein